MIMHFGIRTTYPTEVIYKTLEPGEDETTAIQELLAQISNDDKYALPRYDHSIIVYYDDPTKPDAKREVRIPLDRKVYHVPTKTQPSIKAAFLVYRGTDATHEQYYQRLYEYVENEKLQRHPEIHSIEIMYVPEDLDFVDYTIEIMLPLKTE